MVMKTNEVEYFIINLFNLLHAQQRVLHRHISWEGWKKTRQLWDELLGETAPIQDGPP